MILKINSLSLQLREKKMCYIIKVPLTLPINVIVIAIFKLLKFKILDSQISTTNIPISNVLDPFVKFKLNGPEQSP